MDKFQISIHLVVYNGAAWLPWCLESIKNQTSQNFFLLIIDNSSIDGSYDVCQKFLSANPKLAQCTRLIKNKQNIGFARGHNQAIAWTESEFILILNQDVYLSPDYLEILAHSLANEGRAGVVTGKLLSWQFQAATFHPSQLNSGQEKIIDSFGLSIKRSRRVINLGQGEIDGKQCRSARRVWGVPATAALYRRQALQAVSPGGQVLDEDFVSYKEDVDLAWRLQLGGFEAWAEPEAEAYHDRSLASGSGLKAEYKSRQNRTRELKVYSWANHLAVLVKNEGIFNLMRDLPWFLGHELAKAVFLLFTDPVTLFLGKLKFLKLFPRFYKKRRVLKPTRKISYGELRLWWTKPKVGGREI